MSTNFFLPLNLLIVFEESKFLFIYRQEAAVRNPRLRAGARPHPAPALTLSDPLLHSRVLIRFVTLLFGIFPVFEIILLCFETGTAIILLPVFYERLHELTWQVFFYQCSGSVRNIQILTVLSKIQPPPPTPPL